MAEESFQEKTEQATPKRREESAKKGQVAKSQELNSAVVLWGIPGRGMPFDPLLGALLAFALLTVVLRTTPARRARNSEPRGARSARLGGPARDT